MKRVVTLSVLVLMLAGCSGGTSAASRDRTVDSTTTGTRPDECKRTKEAAEAGSAAFYANSAPNHWPATFQDLTTTNPPALSLPDGAGFTGTKMTGAGWTLTMNATDQSSAPTFSCGA